jgi:hypothetical protein
MHAYILKYNIDPCNDDMYSVIFVPLMIFG